MMRGSQRWGRSLGLLALCGLGAIGVAGCAAGRNDFARLNPGVQFPPLEINESVYLTTEGLDRPYEEIGVLHVTAIAREGWQLLTEKLRNQARQVGADVVLYVRYGTENAFSLSPFVMSIPYDVLSAEGVAVRTKHR